MIVDLVLTLQLKGMMVWIAFSIIAAITAIVIWYTNSSDNFEPELLKGKRVLITGASTGIGEQLAYQYARSGARIMITARREHALKKVVERCNTLSKHTNNFFVMGDMAHLEQTERIIQAAKEKLGGLDILVLNHVSDYHMGWWIGKENLTDFNRRTTINYISYIHLATHAMPLLLNSPGSSIVVVSTVTTITGMPMNGEYPASKLALGGFFHSLRLQFEILKQDISITMCLLGAVRTENIVTLFKNEALLGKDMNEEISPVEPEDAATAIIKAGVLRKKEIFYPSYDWVMTFPGVRPIVDFMVKRFFSTARRPPLVNYKDEHS